MEQINFREEWELIIREFNTPKFHKYTVKRNEKWFNLQLCTYYY
jgi:hypothetical protein